MLKHFPVKQTLVSLSQFTMGQQPKANEISAIEHLGHQILRPYTDNDEHLLVTLHSLVTLQSTSNVPTPYSRNGMWWKTGLGFQHTDPVSDIRGGGLLSLHNLIYFLANHPRKATNMLKKRANRQLTEENTFTSFPWACAGINLTRLLALEFEVIRPSGMSNAGNNAQYSNKTSWRYLCEANGFNRMFVCVFLLLDYFWDEMNATYMDFNRVLKVVSEEFSMQLAMSTSLSNLENRIHKRIQFIDPEYVDYKSLPEAASPVNTFPLLDMESQCFSASSSSQSESNSLFDFLTSQIPSYNEVVEALVPTPSSTISTPGVTDCVPDFLCGDFEPEQHQLSVRRRTPYSMQIV